MDLERAMETIYLERQNLNKNKVLSGIKTLDNLIKGFDTSKKYLVVGQKGMAIETFINTIKNNVDILYNSQIKTHFIDFQYVESQKLESISLDDLEQKTIENYDIIVSIYRPSYFKKTLNDNCLEIEILKSTETPLSNDKLVLDIKNKRVKSIRDNTVLEKFSNRLKTYLTE